MKNEKFTELSYFFKVLAESSRLEIIDTLLSGEKSVGDIADMTDNSQSAVSHQLRILRDARVVKTRKEGHHVFYSLDDEHVVMLYKLGKEHLSHD